MKIYLVRHGETEWNRLHKRQGRIDMPLNDTGVGQAEALRDQLKGFSFDICYSSPLSRARQTAEIIVDGKCKIIFDDRLIERDFGLLEGTNSEIRSGIDYWDIKLNSYEKGVEPVCSLLAREKEILDRVIYDNKNDARVLIVAHNVILRAIHWNIVGYDNNTDFRKFQLKNAEIREYSL